MEIIDVNSDNSSVDREEIDKPSDFSHPQKRFYRQRAHSNPIADHCFDYPVDPQSFDWHTLYPDCPGSKKIEFLDVGCGYGGLLVELSSAYPNTLILGLEIRVKVCDFVADRIKALRAQHPGQYKNIACLRTNAMKYLPNYLTKGQLSKMFFLFPDPHFKKQKHKWRIISKQLLAEYAFFLGAGGIVYTATDVQELDEWMRNHFTEHPLFQQVEESAVESDPIVPKLFDSTEEGKKVTRNGGKKFIGVFRRVEEGTKTSS